MRDQLKTGCVEWFRDVLDVVPTGWIAGGSVRDYFARVQSASDIDVFFPSVDAFNVSLATISRSNARQIYDHDHVVGFILNRRHVQLIKKHFFPTPEETISNFDFTVCCVAVTPGGDVVHHEHFFEDLSGRRLAINALPFPLSTLERLQRYVSKGYLACNGTLMQLAEAIKQIDLNDPSASSLRYYPDGTPRFVRFD